MDTGYVTIDAFAIHRLAKALRNNERQWLTEITAKAKEEYEAKLLAGHDITEAARCADAVMAAGYEERWRERYVPASTVGEIAAPEWEPEGHEPVSTGPKLRLKENLHVLDQ